MAIGWTGAILFATLSPSDGVPLFEIPIPHFDKLVHFGLFACYAFFVFLSFEIKKGLLAGACIGILLGICTEYLQAYVPGRQTDIYDLLADVLGTFFGLLIAYVVRVRVSDS